MEFCNSDGFLAELDGCYTEGFNKCLRQVKALFPNLDVSQVSLAVVAQTPVRSIDPEVNDELFEDDPTLDVQGNGEAPQEEQVIFVGDENRPIDETKPANNEKVMDQEAPIDQS
nr:hypothetical protein CFP56_67471 [Quercus suber]POE64500.1 hypothetical protein CFP56_67472 [Quercus suber]